MFILLSSISVYSQDYNNVISFDEVLSDVSEYINLVKSPNEIKENAIRLGLSILDIETKPEKFLLGNIFVFRCWRHGSRI